MSATSTAGLKTHRTYRKVRIFRIVELLEVQTTKKPKPGTFNIWYCWTDGPKCETIKEVKSDIDTFLDVDCRDHKIDPNDGVKGLNGDWSDFHN